MSETDRGRPVIVVSGLPRSGTSMAMQMLAAAHIPVVSDGVREPGEDNPRGYFEDERVKALYKDGQDRSWLVEARGKAIKIISFLLSYLPDSNRYKIIFMRRELPEVIASQRKMLERREEPTQDDERLFELWESHLAGVEELMSSAPNIEFIDVAYKDVVDNAAAQAHRIRDFLEMDLDVEKMAAAVDRKLYRNRV
jgi:Sulfotransferase family